LPRLYVDNSVILDGTAPQETDAWTPPPDTTPPVWRTAQSGDFTAQPQGELSADISLDVDRFFNELAQGLTGVNGAAVRVRFLEAATRDGAFGYAQNPGDGNRVWTTRTPMHVASISKFPAAITMLQTLAAHGVNPDTTIEAYLPDDWAQGPNVDRITFRDLMRMTSGICRTGSTADWDTLQALIAQGVTGAHFGHYRYDNANYGLLRVLVTTMNDKIDTSTPANTPDTIRFWERGVIRFFGDAQNTGILFPVDAYGISLQARPEDAVSYNTNFDRPMSWGDLSDMSASAGLHMSVDQVDRIALDFMSGRLAHIAPSDANAILQNFYGVDPPVLSTPIGDFYVKDGAWGNAGSCPGTASQQQTVVFISPSGWIITVFINSPPNVGGHCGSLRQVVSTALLASIH